MQASSVSEELLKKGLNKFSLEQEEILGQHGIVLMMKVLLFCQVEEPNFPLSHVRVYTLGVLSSDSSNQV
jgi:hypothetical protein